MAKTVQEDTAMTDRKIPSSSIFALDPANRINIVINNQYFLLKILFFTFRGIGFVKIQTN